MKKILKWLGNNIVGLAALLFSIYTYSAVVTINGDLNNLRIDSNNRYQNLSAKITDNSKSTVSGNMNVDKSVNSGGPRFFGGSFSDIGTMVQYGNEERK